MGWEARTATAAVVAIPRRTLPLSLLLSDLFRFPLKGLSISPRTFFLLFLFLYLLRTLLYRELCALLLREEPRLRHITSKSAMLAVQ